MDSRGMMSAMNPMLLQHVLRGLCTSDSQWVYAVFWRILPRNYPPPQWNMEGGGIMDRSKGNRRNWILVWEDGFCNFLACLSHSRSAFVSVPHFGSSNEIHCQQQQQQQEFPELGMSPEIFFKMSHDAYNYGEGLIGKVALDKSHKWVYPEPLENEAGFFSSSDSNIDPPRTWEGQFKAGIQTIAVIAVEEGVLQLGSTQKIMEDLNFVLYIQRKFNFLHSVPGLLVPHPTASSSGIEGQQLSPDCCVSTMTNMISHHGSNEPFLLFPMTSTPADNPESTSQDSLLNWSQYSLDSGTPEVHVMSNGALLTIPHASMASSLQALLSKLPNVTVPLEDNSTGYVYPAYASNGHNFEVTTGFNDFHQLPAVSSDGSDLQRLVDGECTAYSSVGTSVGGEDGEFESRDFVAYEDFTEFGIQEALHNGDSSFTSFLNETCS